MRFDAYNVPVQPFIEFELTISELCSVLYLLSILTQLLTPQNLIKKQFIYIIATFLRIAIASQLKDTITLSD